MAKRIVIIDKDKRTEQRAEITLKCLMHKARATKLVIGKYSAK